VPAESEAFTECRAKVTADSWYYHTCPRRAVKVRMGRGVCGTHANMFDRWAETGKNTENMAEFWWGWARD